MWADTRIWRTSALSGTETEETKGDQTPASSIGSGSLAMRKAAASVWDRGCERQNEGRFPARFANLGERSYRTEERRA